MSELTDRIAAEHLHWPGLGQCRCGVELIERGCGCNEATDAYTQHVAKETEWAVRAQVAADIRAEMPAPTTRRSGKSARRILHHAARIAEGSAD